MSDEITTLEEPVIETAAPETLAEVIAQTLEEKLEAYSALAANGYNA